MAVDVAPIVYETMMPLSKPSDNMMMSVVATK
jgi:hypothetical protein